MKKTTLIILLMLFVAVFSATAIYTPPATFSKVYSNSTQYLNQAGVAYAPFSYDTSYIHYNNSIYNKTTFQRVATATISSSVYTMYDATYLYGVYFSSVYKLAQYYGNNASLKSSLSSPDNLDLGFTFEGLYTHPSFIVDHLFATYADGDFRVASTTNMNFSCNAPALQVDTHHAVIGVDSSYIYIARASTTGQPNWAIVDWACNIITQYNSTFFSTYMVPNFTNIVYDADDNFFVGLYEGGTGADKTFTLKTWGTDGVGIDSQSPLIWINNASNFTIGFDDHNCDYDSTNNIYYCVGYKNGVVGDVALVGVPLDTYGYIDNNLAFEYTAYDDFNSGVVDLYTLTNDQFFFLMDGDLYLKMYDTVGGTYDLFKGVGTSINETAGFTCDTSSGYCWNITSTCFDNTEFYTGNNLSNWLCNSTVADGGLYCNNALTQCTGGCENDLLLSPYGIWYYTGTCYNDTTCTNDCAVIGLLYSDSPTSYKRCGQYDTDSCLEWSSSITCGSGNVSINGICQAQNLTSIYSSLTAFAVQPNTTQASSINPSANPQYVAYESDYVFVSPQFAISSTNTGTYYYLRNCNYNETIVYNDVVPTVVNASNFTVNNFAEGYYEVDFENDNETIITATDILSRQIYKYNITSIYNGVTGENDVCLRAANGTGIICISEPLANINDVNVKVLIFTGLDTYTTASITINKNTGASETAYGYIVAKSDASASNAYYFTITGSDTTVNSEKVSTANVYSGGETVGWYATQNGVYRSDCVTNDLGCRVMRTYYSDYYDGFLWNYKDWNVCVNRLGNTTATTTTGGGAFNNFSDAFNFSATTKLIIALLSLVVVFIVIAGFGMTGTDGSTSRIVLWLAVMIDTGLLIFYAVIGWVAIWILVLMACFSAMVLIFFFRKVFFGGGDSDD